LRFCATQTGDTKSILVSDLDVAIRGDDGAKVKVKMQRRTKVKKARGRL